MELIARQAINEIEKNNEYIDFAAYADPDCDEYRAMIDLIGQKLQFDSLQYHRLDDMLAAVGLAEDKLCTYCWSGKHES
jgi:amidophosphoribosyltransferase